MGERGAVGDVDNGRWWRALVTAAVLLLTFARQPVRAAEKQFTGSISHDWLNDDNWMPAGTPTVIDDVTIPAGQTAELGLARTINTLLLGGTLTGSGNLTVSGMLTWSGGVMSGSGATNANGGLALIGPAPKALQRTLNNAGAAAWSDAGDLVFAAAGTFNNLHSASFTVQNDRTVSFSGGSVRFDNAGTFIKTSGARTAFSNVPFINSGTVTVHGGILQLSGGGTYTGTFDATGATLEFGGGTHNLSATAILTGTDVTLSGGTVNLSGSYDVGAQTTVTGGTANFTGKILNLGKLLISNGTLNLSSTEGAATVPMLTLSAGTLTGSSHLTINEMFLWSGGTMSGTGTTIATGGLSLSGTGTKALNRTLRNTGAAIWSDAGNWVIGSGGTFNNQSGSSLVVRNDAAVNAGGGAPQFNNLGTVTKSAGALTRINVPLNNDGTVDVQSGTLTLAAGGTHTGRFSFVGETLELAGGTHHFAAPARVEGGAAVLSGATVSLEGRWGTTAVAVSAGSTVFTGSVGSVGTVSISNGAVDFSNTEGSIDMLSLTLSGGALIGSSRLAVQGPFNWTGGVMGGVGTTTALGGLALSGVASKVLNRTLDNVGAATWMDAGSLSLGTTGTFNNVEGATFTAQTDALLGGAAGVSQFNNAGRFIKADGTLTRVNAAFNNSGAVHIERGTLALAGGGVHSGTFIAPDTTVEFAGGTHDLGSPSRIVASNATFSSGSTSVRGVYNVSDHTLVGGGTTAFTGNVVNTGTVTISSATADFSNVEGAVSFPTLTLLFGTLAGSSTVTVPGLLSWMGGTMRGTGTTNALGGLLLGSTNPKVLSRPLNNLAAATWIDAGTFNIDGGGRLTNQPGATFDVQSDSPLLTAGGTPRLDNAGTFLKSLGTLTIITVPFSNTGTVEARSGILALNGGYTQTAGVTRLNGGALQSTRTLNINDGGLEGSGTIRADVATAAQVNPGLPAGQLTVIGSYIQNAGGALNLEVGGADSSQFDRLATGTATLGGTLNIRLVNGFVPQPGDRFPIMTFDSLNGDFATIAGLVIGIGQGFNRTIDQTNMTLEFGEEDCSDGQDNDGDGRVDCADPKCAAFLPCTFTPTPTATAVATDTPTVTPTPTETQSPTPHLVCAADCNDDGEVTVDELLTLVNIALGDAELSACSSGDVSGDLEITIDEILFAVNHALNECP